MLDVIRKNVFLSGPMSSIHNNNAAAFADAHATLKQMGASHVYDPAYEWLKEPNNNSRGHDYYMRRSIWELVKMDSNCKPFYDMVVLLDGWEESEGCRTEVEVAQACGIDVYSLSIATTDCGCCCDCEDDGEEFGSAENLEFVEFVASVIRAFKDENGKKDE